MNNVVAGTPREALVYPESYSYPSGSEPNAFESFSQSMPEPISAMLEHTVDSIEAYAREKPWSFGLWMLGAGFVLGWKLKPW
jgi:hypothetical protein